MLEPIDSILKTERGTIKQVIYDGFKVAAESGAVCHGNVSPLVVPMSTYS
jgi:hypothetical protein